MEKGKSKLAISLKGGAKGEANDEASDTEPPKNKLTCKHCKCTTLTENPLWRLPLTRRTTKQLQRFAIKRYTPWARHRNNEPEGEECYICWVVVRVTVPGKTVAQAFVEVYAAKVEWGHVRQRWIDMRLGTQVDSFSEGTTLKNSQTQSMNLEKQWDFIPEEIIKELFPEKTERTT